MGMCKKCGKVYNTVNMTNGICKYCIDPSLIEIEKEEWLKLQKEEEAEIMNNVQNKVDAVETSNTSSSKWIKASIFGLIIFITLGEIRIYTGGDIGLKIVTKRSFSFTDTFANLDDILGKPRFVVASEHPAVKRQLEEMGILETDEQVQKRVEADMQVKMDATMRDIQAQQADAMREYQNQMRRLGY